MPHRYTTRFFLDVRRHILEKNVTSFFYVTRNNSSIATRHLSNIVDNTISFDLVIFQQVLLLVLVSRTSVNFNACIKLRKANSVLNRTLYINYHYFVCYGYNFFRNFFKTFYQMYIRVINNSERF